MKFWIILLAFVFLVLAFLLFADKAHSEEFKCHPAPDISVLGIDEKLAISRLDGKMDVKETISLKDNKPRFDLILNNIQTVMKRQSIWPIDEFVFMKPTSGSNFDPFKGQFSILYIYKGCLLNFTVFPDSFEKIIFGDPA